MNTLSYSRMDSFNCPRYFALSYMKDGRFKTRQERDEDFQAVPPEMGKAAHEVMKRFCTAMTEQGVTPEGLEEMITEEWEARNLPGDRLAEFKSMCRNSTETLERNVDFSEVVSIEDPFEIDLENGWTLNGIMDLVLNKKDFMVVLDHKSDFYKRSTSELDNDFQTDVYSYVLWKNYGVKKVGVFMNFMRYKGLVPSIREDDQFFLDTEAAIKDYARRIGEAIESKDFTRRNPNNNCRFCEERVSCLKAKADGIADMENAEVLATFGYFKKVSKHLEDAAKARMADQAPIQIGKKLCGFVSAEGKTPEYDDQKKIFTVLEKYKIDWKAKAKISNTDIFSIQKKKDTNPLLKEELKKLGVFPLNSKFVSP